MDYLAAGLLALGLQKGDRLGIWGPNTYEWILFQFATAKAGIIMVSMSIIKMVLLHCRRKCWTLTRRSLQVSLNPAYKVYELEFALRKVSFLKIFCILYMYFLYKFTNTGGIVVQWLALSPHGRKFEPLSQL